MDADGQIRSRRCSGGPGSVRYGLMPTRREAQAPQAGRADKGFHKK